METTRRAFVQGRWSSGRPAGTTPSQASCEIVSLVVQCRPEHLSLVAEEIDSAGGGEIHARDPRGKLVVVLEAPDQGAIGAKLHEISRLPHVLAATMVFQATDGEDAIAGMEADR